MIFNLPLDIIAFRACLFFLIGILLISILKNVLFVSLIGGFIFILALILKKYSFLPFIIFIVIGAFYYQIYENIKNEVNMPFDTKTEFTGVIKNIDQSQTSQDIILALEKPLNGLIEVYARPYPVFQYGDLIKLTGIVKEPPEKLKNYYSKNGISGIVNFANLELIESGHGNSIKAALLSFKNKIVEIFRQSLPDEKAAFLAGITIGERSSFSKEFKQKMSLSGTTHLVAMSGYNISVIALTIGVIFGSFLSPAISFYISVLFIILFVLMTGAEASVVRAAIMGIIALVAQKAERIYSLRNAITIAAFLMVLFNPMVLFFDVGFQLSFAALMGIIYLQPALKSFFKIESRGLLSWKENALTTVSAQLAVIPLLLANFGVFSLTSFFANILILGVMPMTMGLGFVMASFGFVSIFLAQIIGLAVNILISYEFFIINLFSKFTLMVSFEKFSIIIGIIYYIFLIFFIYKFNKKD